MGCLHTLDMADAAATAHMVESLAAVAEDSSNPSLRWLTAVYRCGYIQVVGTGDDVEAAATEALARGEEANEPDAFLWYAPRLLTARIMQGRVAEVMDVVRQGAANPGLPVWQPVFARMLLYVGEVDEAAEVMDACSPWTILFPATGCGCSHTCSWARSCRCSERLNRRQINTDDWRLSLDALGV